LRALHVALEDHVEDPAEVLAATQAQRRQRRWAIRERAVGGAAHFGVLFEGFEESKPRRFRQNFAQLFPQFHFQSLTNGKNNMIRYMRACVCAFINSSGDKRIKI